MTQFKETDTFQDLQARVFDDITGVALSHLKEAGVPEDRINQLSESIHYDLAAVMNDLGNQQVPGAELYADKMKATLKEMSALKDKVQALSGMEEKVREMTALEDKVRELELQLRAMAALEDKIRELEAREATGREEAASEESSDDLELPDLEFDSLESILGEDESAEEDIDHTTTDAVLDMDKAQEILKSIKSS